MLYYEARVVVRLMTAVSWHFTRSRDTKPWAKFADFRRAGRLFQFIFVSLQLKVGSINELAMDSRLSWRRCLFSIRKRSGLRDSSEKQKDTVREA